MTRFNDFNDNQEREADEARRERRATDIDRFLPPEYQMWDYSEEGQDDVNASVPTAEGEAPSTRQLGKESTQPRHVD